jgi:hypothetical protein
VKGDVEGAGMGHVCGCGEKFGEYITGVAGCLYTPDLNFPTNVVLPDSMVSDIDTPTMLVHRGTGCNVLGSLVVREEVSGR